MLITSIDDIKENIEDFKEKLGEQLKSYEGVKRFKSEKYYARGQYDMCCLFGDWIDELETSNNEQIY